MVWKPNVTVAAVAQRQGRFLLIEEVTSRGLLFNQPAGHLEPGESLVDAVAREALEESAYSFRATALIGVYHYHSTSEGVTYLRFAFAGEVDDHDPEPRSTRESCALSGLHRTTSAARPPDTDRRLSCAASTTTWQDAVIRSRCSSTIPLEPQRS